MASLIFTFLPILENSERILVIRGTFLLSPAAHPPEDAEPDAAAQNPPAPVPLTLPIFSLSA